MGQAGRHAAAHLWALFCHQTLQLMEQGLCKELLPRLIRMYHCKCKVATNGTASGHAALLNNKLLARSQLLLPSHQNKSGQLGVLLMNRSGKRKYLLIFFKCDPA